MEESDTEFSKEVTVVAYATEASSETKREFANRLVSADLLEKTSTQQREVNMEVKAGKGTLENKIYDHYFSEEGLKDLKEEVANCDLISITDKSWNENKFSTSMRVARSQIQERVAVMLPHELSGGLTFTNLGSPEWNYDDNPEWRVRFSNVSFDKKRVLSKESKREDDDLYETMGERNCVTFNVKMNSPQEFRLDQWTDEVIKNMVKALRKVPEIGKVRFMACQVEEKREGECYNI